MIKKFSFINYEILLIVILVLAILPFPLLTFFNNPSAEDFFYGERTKRLGFINAQYSLYKTWNGRFFAHSILSVNPLLFKSIIGYKLLTLLLMLLFFFVLFLFISEITNANITFKEKMLVTLSVIFLYLYSMPSVSEGFYWLTSVTVYHIAIILIMLFIILYVRLNRAHKLYFKILFTLLCCLTLISIAGTNEISMGLMVILIMLLLIHNFHSNKKIKLPLIFFVLSIAVASYIVISSPGNQVRGESYPEQHEILYSLSVSFSFLIKRVFSWTFISPLLAISVLLLPAFSKITKSGSETFLTKPVQLIIAFFTLLYASIFIPVWSTGQVPYGRTLNIIFFIFLIGWFYIMVVLAFYISKKFNTNSERLPKYLSIVAFVIIFIFLLKQSNVKTAYSDLFNGTAYRFNSELNDRYNFILQSTEDNCEVFSLKNIPKTIFGYEITEDPLNIYNQWYARYFNKKSISLKKE